jgi:hypothetical protein
MDSFLVVPKDFSKSYSQPNLGLAIGAPPVFCLFWGF